MRDEGDARATRRARRPNGGRPLRVLHLTGGRVFGGIESFLCTLAQVATHASQLEHVFVLAFPGELERRLRAAGATVHVMGGDGLRASRLRTVLAARRALVAVVARARADVALVHGPWSYAVFGGVLRKRLPTVLMAHGAARDWRWPDAWVRIRPPRGVIANSGWTEREAHRAWPGLRTRVVSLAVPPSTVPTTRRSEVRAALGAHAETVVVIMVSRIEHGKGHDLLLRALRDADAAAPWQAWLVGGAQQPSERAALAALLVLASELGIADRVRFLGQRDDVSALAAAADVYCQPNRTPDAFGIAIVEALYAGLPVITSRLGGPAEIVTDACGVLVPLGDGAALATALARLIDDAGARAGMAAAARARAALVSDPVECSVALREALAELSGAAC